MSVSNRAIAYNIFGLLTVKAMSMFISLATIPVLLKFFHEDKEAMGAWFVFFASTTMLVALDFGVGNRLKNDILSRISGKREYSDLICDAFAAQMLVSLSVGIAVIGGGGLLWVGQTTTVEIGRIVQQNPSLLVFASVFIIFLMPLRLSYFILQAEQRNAVSALIVAIPQMTILIYAFLATKTTDLPATLRALAAIFLLSNIFAYAIPLAWRVARMRGPLPQEKRTKRVGSLVMAQIVKLKPGASFFLMQLSIMFLYGSNELFYLLVGTTTDIVHYQYYFRPFSLFSVGFSIVSLPFWSAIRLSYLRGDYRRVRQLFSVILLLNIPVLLALLPSAYFFQNLIDAWLGGGVYVVSNDLLVLFVLSSMLICIMHAMSAILNAFDFVDFQATVLVFALLIKATVMTGAYFLGVKCDHVMLATNMGLLFVVAALAYKAVEFWKSNLVRLEGGR